MKIRNFLMLSLAIITRHPRYRPELVWSSKIWVSNAFRAYEWIFGRGEGIRAEVLSQIEVVDGKLMAKYQLLSFEATIVHFEVVLRKYIFLLRCFLTFPQPRLNYQPVYLTLGILGFIFSFKTSMHLLPFFGLAIAHDTDTNSTAQSGASYNWSHTCTGSNLVLATGVAFRPAGASVSALTYNTVALTKIRGDNNGNRLTELWYLLNPATGAHSIAVTLTGSPGLSSAGAVSLTGVLALDANNGANNAGSTTPSVSVTTIADNCWLVDVLNAGVDDGVATPSSGQTAYFKVISTTSHTGSGSYKGPKTPAGATTMSYTITSSNWAISAASFSPVVATTNHFLSLLGVGS